MSDYLIKCQKKNVQWVGRCKAGHHSGEQTSDNMTPEVSTTVMDTSRFVNLPLDAFICIM